MGQVTKRVVKHLMKQQVLSILVFLDASEALLGEGRGRGGGGF